MGEEAAADGTPSPEIVPRWEWRTFGSRLGAAEAELVALEPESVHESDELYLLSAADGDTVKVRDGLMDVKRLQHESDDGLEQWLPVTKAAFPLPAAEVAALLAGLHVLAPRLERAEYALEELLAEVVDPDPSLLAVEVRKRRQRHTLGGCPAERTEVTTERGSTRTIAVEGEDPSRVLAAVRKLGLTGRKNMNYPRALRALVGFGAGRFAVIDVGTNSVKFHVGERDPDGTWTTVVDRAEITRLGEGLGEAGELGAVPMERTVEAIATMAEEAEAQGALRIAAVGTAGLRIASNALTFVAAVESRCEAAVQVISGAEEARLAYLAAISGLGLHDGSLAAFDSGGGSSQFTFGSGDRVDEQFSVDVGAVRFTEQFGLGAAVPEDVLEAALDAIAADLHRLDGRPSPDTLIAMGGTSTNLAAVKHGLAAYDPDVVQGTVLDRAEIDRQIEVYRARSVEERREIVGLQPKRADVILAGACIVRTVLTKLGSDSMTVSDRALRHGLLVERFPS
jgi:exopolyphosphatase/guanosine-5'-triphosphate,3'-diphosphate pyrophosphatase